jgi:predicted anti-sigma-YlaC factor YlaD
LAGQRILRRATRPEPAAPELAQRLEATTGAEACEEIRLELGVYLLGAVGAPDRAAVEGHLASCADCRNLLAMLAGLPGLLHRVAASDADLDAGTVAAIAPEPDDTVPFRGRRSLTGKQNRNSAH